jgi:Polysaccharide lyase
MSKNLRSYLTVLSSVSLFIYIGAGMAFYFHNVPLDSSFPLTDNFETETLAKWQDKGFLELCCDHSATFVQRESGGKALAFEVDKTDPDIKNRKRAEIRAKAHYMGDYFRYEFEMQIDNAWIFDDIPVTVTQWHAVPDRWLGETGVAPPLRIIVKGNQYVITQQWDAKKISRFLNQSAQPEGGIVLWSGDIHPGVWESWRFEVRWAYQGEVGITQIWRNNTLVASRNGPNAYNDSLAPFFKIGIYIPTWIRDEAISKAAKRRIFFDNININKLQ